MHVIAIYIKQLTNYLSPNKINTFLIEFINSELIYAFLTMASIEEKLVFQFIISFLIIVKDYNQSLMVSLISQLLPTLNDMIIKYSADSNLDSLENISLLLYNFVNFDYRIDYLRALLESSFVKYCLYILNNNVCDEGICLIIIKCFSNIFCDKEIKISIKSLDDSDYLIEILHKCLNDLKKNLLSNSFKSIIELEILSLTNQLLNEIS